MKKKTTLGTQRGRLGLSNPAPRVSDLVAAIKRGAIAVPHPRFSAGPPPDVRSQQEAIEKLLAGQLDPEGKAARQFEKIVKKRAKDTTVLRARLNAKARAASKGWGARLRKELEERVAALPPDQRQRYFIDRPFLIWTDASLEADYTIAPGASSAKFAVDTKKSSANGLVVSFYYLWTNDTDQPVSVNINGYLIANGYVELDSDGGYFPGTRFAQTNLTAEGLPFEWWHNPPTLPPFQASEIQNALYMRVSSGGFAAAGGFDARALFRGYDLQYQQLLVSARGSVVVQVVFVVDAWAIQGRAQIDFNSGQRSIVSPGVLVTVL